MKRPILAVSLVLAAALFFVVGLWIGIREGAQLTILAEKPPQGVIALRVIELSQEGARPDQIRTVLEMWVDQGLVGAYKYFNSPAHFLFESPNLPDVGPPWQAYHSVAAHMEEWTAKLANYRKEHPSPMPAWRDEFLPDEHFGEQIAARRREEDRILKLMVERYAKK